MDVWVLMADGGYDGEGLLGVYDSEEAANAAAREWKPDPAFVGYLPYVVPVQVGAAAELRFAPESR